MPFLHVGARFFGIAAGLIASIAVVAPPAWAQRTCDLSALLPQVTGTIGNTVAYTVKWAGNTVGSTSNTVGLVINPGGVVLQAPGAGSGIPTSALQPLADGLQNLITTIPNLTNNIPQLTANVQNIVESLPVQNLTEPLEVVINLAGADRLVDNLCDATKGLGVQSGLAVVGATSLTGAIMGRLDAGRMQGAAGGSGGDSSTSVASAGGGTDGRMALGVVEKGRPTPPPGGAGPFTVFAGGTFLGGHTSDMPDATGFSYSGGSGMLGLEYSVNRNLILGVAGSFATMDADLNTGATVGADVIHGATYLSYATRELFVDALAAYGAIDLDLGRPGTTEETVRGSTDGSAVAVAARGGYLLDFGKLRAGPIAGLTYVHARIDGYSEAGADPSAMKVGDQAVDSLTGSAGLRFLAPFQAGGSVFVPYLNVTLEHHFGDGKAELTSSLTGAPSGSPVSVSFPTFGARDYGKVEGGLTVELAPSASISVSGASTFARDDGHDYRIGAGLNYRF